MFAIAFDLVVAEAEEHHPRGVTTAFLADLQRSHGLELSFRAESATCHKLA